MKNKKQIGLDVDFIGGDTPLTDKEEKQLSDYFIKSKPLTETDRNAISEYILQNKNKNVKGILTKKKVVSSKKQLVHS